MAIESVNKMMGSNIVGYSSNIKIQETVSADNISLETETDSNVEKVGIAKSIASNSDAANDNNFESNDKVTVSNEQLKKAIEQFNNSRGNSEAIYGIHEGTNRVTIKIVDKDTKKVIKELPPEKTLDMIARVWEMAGILVDEKR